jgi:hypothetical protein
MSYELILGKIKVVQLEQQQNQSAQEQLKLKFEFEKERLYAEQLDLVQKEKKLFKELRSL